MKNGGKREGAGRPVGSTTKPQLVDYLKEGQVEKLIKKAVTEANKGKSDMLKFVLEQILGRAKQSTELSGGLTLDGVLQIIHDRRKTNNKDRGDDIL